MPRQCFLHVSRATGRHRVPGPGKTGPGLKKTGLRTGRPIRKRAHGLGPSLSPGASVSSRARRTNTDARCLLNSALALRSLAGSASSLANAAGVGRAGPAGHGILDRPRSQRRQTHVYERHPDRPVYSGCRPFNPDPLVATATTPTVAQSCARRLNFWKDQPPGAFGTRISVSISSGTDRRLQETDEEVACRDLTAAAGPLYDKGGVKGQYGRRQVRRRVPVGQRPADRPPVAHLRVADLTGDVGQHRHSLARSSDRSRS